MGDPPRPASPRAAQTRRADASRDPAGAHGDPYQHGRPLAGRAVRRPGPLTAARPGREASKAARPREPPSGRPGLRSTLRGDGWPAPRRHSPPRWPRHGPRRAPDPALLPALPGPGPARRQRARPPAAVRCPQSGRRPGARQRRYGRTQRTSPPATPAAAGARRPVRQPGWRAPPPARRARSACGPEPVEKVTRLRQPRPLSSALPCCPF